MGNEGARLYPLPGGAEINKGVAWGQNQHLWGRLWQGWLCLGQRDGVGVAPQAAPASFSVVCWGVRPQTSPGAWILAPP